MKKRPVTGQKLKALLASGDVFDAEVIEIWDVKNESLIRGKVDYVFRAIIKDVPSDRLPDKTSDIKVRSSDHHFEPHPMNNINWTDGGSLANIFFFEKEENLLKHNVDVIKLAKDSCERQLEQNQESLKLAEQKLEEYKSSRGVEGDTI